MCVLAQQKCAGVHGRAPKVCCLIFMLFIQPCIESGTLSLRFGDRQSFFVIFVFKCGLPGLLVAAELLKMRAVAH